jgi:hypothetical protein
LAGITMQAVSTSQIRARTSLLHPKGKVAAAGGQAAPHLS